MIILLNSPDRKSRDEVNVEVVKESPHSVWVRLPDGNVIKRKKKRDVREGGGKE